LGEQYFFIFIFFRGKMAMTNPVKKLEWQRDTSNATVLMYLSAHIWHVWKCQNDFYRPKNDSHAMDPPIFLTLLDSVESAIDGGGERSFFRITSSDFHLSLDACMRYYHEHATTISLHAFIYCVGIPTESKNWFCISLITPDAIFMFPMEQIETTLPAVALPASATKTTKTLEAGAPLASVIDTTVQDTNSIQKGKEESSIKAILQWKLTGHNKRHEPSAFVREVAGGTAACSNVRQERIAAQRVILACANFPACRHVESRASQFRQAYASCKAVYCCAACQKQDFARHKKRCIVCTSRLQKTNGEEQLILDL
jgi:hypothetical protein